MGLKSSDQKQIEQTVGRMISAGRDIALAYFRQPDQGLANKLSDGFDPVTQADKEIELAFREILKAERPMDGILGEEFPPVASQSGYTWVLDPIDGTRGFISGTPTWGMLIALSDAQGPIWGAIDQPYTGETFMGGLGRAELRRAGQTTPLATRQTTTLADAILFTTFPEVGTANERAAFQRVSSVAKLTRYGMDCYAYGLLAAGQVDLVIEAGLNAYDIQAPIAVVEAAGGIVTNWKGGPAHAGGTVVAAANSDIYAQAIALLNQ
ncbi:histidinol-phosphatase [Amylibacter marinus]|uniref:Histidinol-phosphatase n=1 Tax=Amylibacter marinus TaxID=1475483 RepID=A0ABQ5VSX9_9RHOB|nr:inositol monophosphatase family protein [Amylibacter marinus]GLQ34535.1 histidinol-phosphatase [Amylibacter marinus]